MQQHRGRSVRVGDRGGLGADDFDGGLGVDSVTYLESGHEGVRLVVTIDTIADDGARKLGETANEGDNVRTSNEVVEGNSGNDTFIGNELSNTLRGQLGKDNLIGGRGADVVEGSPGDDQLAGNGLFGVPVADGSIDTLNGGDGTDYCRVPFFSVETDILISCENVNQD